MFQWLKRAKSAQPDGHYKHGNKYLIELRAERKELRKAVKQ